MLVVDISHWQGKNIDIAMWKQEGVDMVISKSSDCGVYGNCWVEPEFWAIAELCTKFGMVLGTYMWDNPSFAAKMQVDYFYKNVVSIVPHLRFIAPDCEQEKTKVFEPNKPVQYQPYPLTYHTADTIAAMKQIGLPMLPYTRSSWINDFCPALWNKLDGQGLWLASYPYSVFSKTEVANILGMAAVGKKYFIRTDWASIRNTYIPRLLEMPKPKNGTTRLWQFSGDRFYLPGATTPLDLNWAPGTFEDWITSLGGTIPVPSCIVA